jgi:hypothetical protein
VVALSVIWIRASAVKSPVIETTATAPANGLKITRTSGAANVAGAKGDIADGNVKANDVISDAVMKLSSIAESGTENVPLTVPANGAGMVVVNV